MNQEAPRQDGSFDFSWSDGVLSLRVVKPAGGGRLLPAMNILQRVREFGIRNVQDGKVIEIVQQADGEFHPLVEYHPTPATATVEIAPSGLEAFVTLVAPQPFGAELTFDKLTNLLEEEGARFGVNESVLSDLVEEKPYGKRMRVALGEPPKGGGPGTIEVLFDLDPVLPSQ